MIAKSLKQLKLAKTGTMQSWGSGTLLFSGYGSRCTNVLKRRKVGHYCSQEKEIGALLFSGEGNCQLVFYWSQEKATGALMFSGEGNLVHYCFQDKEGALLYLGEVKRCSTVYRRRGLVLYCSQEKKLENCCSQEKETCSQLLSGEGNWCFYVSGEGIWCYTVLRRKKLADCCSQEKETGALMFQEKGSGALQTAVLKGKETGALLLMFSREGRWGCTYRFYRFYRFYLYKTLIFICLSR